MIEIWKKIPGHEDYEASNLGRIRRMKRGPHTRPGKILKPLKQRTGYYRVCLFFNGKRNYLFVHRVVLETLVGPCPPGTQGNHRDGNKANNNVENLEWLTPSQNIRHSFNTGLEVGKKGETNSQAKLTAEQVRLIKLSPINARSDFITLGERFGVSEATIRDIRKGRRWGHILTVRPERKEENGKVFINPESRFIREGRGE